jgi:tetratricopeptide (TPR) repeat protein
VPNFLATQLSAKALCVEGRYFESLGKHREALENYLTVLAMGRDYMSPGNTFISHLIGLAVTSVGTSQIRAEVATGKLSAPDLERCRARLDAIDKTYPPTLETFRSEELCRRWDIERIRKDGNAESLITELKLAPEQAAEFRQAAKDIDRVEADHERIWDFILQNAETPWWKQGQEETRKELEGLVKASHPLVANSILNFQEAGARWCTTRAGLRLARVATALEIYKAANGKYPASLDALTPAQVGTEPPIDPFSGKPLRYRLDGDRYALWSIGPDSADNAGETIYDPTNGTMSQGDIILRR